MAEKKTVKLSNEEEMETNVEENPVPLLIPINQEDLLVFSFSYFVVLPLADDLGKLSYYPFFSIQFFRPPICPTLSSMQYATCAQNVFNSKNFCSTHARIVCIAAHVQKDSLELKQWNITCMQWAEALALTLKWAQHSTKQ